MDITFLYYSRKVAVAISIYLHWGSWLYPGFITDVTSFLFFTKTFCCWSKLLNCKEKVFLRKMGFRQIITTTIGLSEPENNSNSHDPVARICRLNMGLNALQRHKFARRFCFYCFVPKTRKCGKCTYSMLFWSYTLSELFRKGIIFLCLTIYRRKLISDCYCVTSKNIRKTWCQTIERRRTVRRLESSTSRQIRCRLRMLRHFTYSYGAKWWNVIRKRPGNSIKFRYKASTRLYNFKTTLNGNINVHKYSVLCLNSTVIK